MTLPIASNVFADGELTNEASWYTRIFSAINTLYAVVGTDSGWQVPTLGNSWVNFGAPYQVARYRKVSGWVSLEGSIKNGTTSTTIFTLPAGYRPGDAQQFLGVSNAFTARIRVDNTGTVQVDAYATGGNNAVVSLDQVRFYAEQ